MSLALKCDFCKDFFTFNDNKYLPNTISFSRYYINEECGSKLNTCYNIAPDKIKKNAYHKKTGVYAFNICEKCIEKVVDLIINSDEEEEVDDNT